MRALDALSVRIIADIIGSTGDGDSSHALERRALTSAALCISIALLRVCGSLVHANRAHRRRQFQFERRERVTVRLLCLARERGAALTRARVI